MDERGIDSIELRDYQQLLYNICVNKNSILYLPTGSGKTLIAIKVIDHFNDDLKKPLSEGGKRSLFLVNTVVLANQIHHEIKNMLGLKVACWNSETRKTTWSKERYQNEFENHQVFVATAQLFLDAIKHSFISIQQINVIIFDECHHGRLNHPYHELMKMFKYIDPLDQPRVVGLSGMLIGISSSVNETTVKDELKVLESTFLSTIVTVHRLEEYKNVLLYSTNPTENFITYNMLEPCDLATQLIAKVDNIRWNLSNMKFANLLTINPQTLRKTAPKKLKELSLLFEDFKNELKEMGIFGGYLALKGIKVQYELVKKQPNQHKDILTVVDICIEGVEEMLTMIEDEVDMKNLTANDLIENSSYKIRILFGLLKKMFTESRVRDLQCLIFMTRRFTAKCCYHLFKKYSELEPSFPIIPDFVVGVNSELPESIDEALNSNNNKDAIERFRMKQSNCICASSVLEEGIDLQMCNLVVMYDYPMTFRSYIQTKGRARTVDSNYIVMLPTQKKQSFLFKRDVYEKINLSLKKMLVMKACDRELDEDGIENERREVWEPLITKRRALLNNISAVALLNRYVSRFGNANLMWTREDKGPGRIIAILKLPPKTKIHGVIRSDPFDDIKLSKQNAAFKACTKLHDIGELDEHLMPKYY
ncbi:CLUMA_CG009933, isoform A [Clunio marinus]|uniref:CLUMA_CG009933, isoform A n=1 Tax=Clunio marinus TaxID=568069 RepID=A0A1J1IAF6_9DIPT|nr:CLUMA_CG009933, isoform A [Clunio marinus]